jgi:flagellar FliL protein
MATSAAPAVAAEAAPPSPPRGKGRLVVVVALALVVLGGGGAGAWWFFLRPGAHAVAEAPKIEETVRATVPLGAVVVNLNGESRRYLRVGVSLGISNVKETKAIEEKKAELLDLLIGVLSATEVAALTSEDGRAELKEALLERIRDELALPAVARIYFTEFVIQ